MPPSAQQRKSPGPSAERPQPVNLSVAEIKETLATAKVTQTQTRALYTGAGHRIPSADDENISVSLFLKSVFLFLLCLNKC